MPGRKPLPEKVKEARGNPSKRRVRPNVLPPRGVPDPPESIRIRPRALAEYKRMSDVMEKMEVGTELDMVDVRDAALSFDESERLAVSLAGKVTTDEYRDISIRLLNWMKLGQAAREKLCITKSAQGRLYGGGATSGEDASEALAREHGFE